jgi:TRAP-type C4-dicarboxylate transport system permease small subunit
VILAELFVLAFFILLAWVGYEVLLVLEGDNLVSLPEVSTQVTQSVIPIGAALFVMAEALSLPDIWREARELAPASVNKAPEEAAGP